MNKSAFLPFLAILMAGALQAQTTSTRFIQMMEKNLVGIDTLKTVEQWQNASNAFERIAQKETKEWLPQYYVALCQTMIFNFEKDPAKQEPLCDKTDKYLAKADSLNPNNSEIWVLKSVAASDRIRLNPMVNGQKYGPLSGMALEKAIVLDPENPRAYMEKGLGLFFTPPQWGGDPVKGKELMELAAKKYDAFKPASSIHPAWGKAMNAYLLDMAGKK
jgi:hypothetical protein